MEKDIQPLLQCWKSDGTLIMETSHGKAAFRNLNWAKEGDYLATESDALRIWNRDGELIAEGYSDDNLWGVDWSADGKFIVTSSHEGHISIWDSHAKLIKEINY